MELRGIKRGVVPLFTMLFCLSLISALTTTSPQTANVYYNIETQIVINITNPSNYDIFGVKTNSSIVSVVGVVDIPALSSKNVTLKIKTAEVGNLTRYITLMGYKKISCSNITQSEPHQINISGYGSAPNFLSICTGESVSFFNNYDSWIKLKIYPDVDYGNQIPTQSNYVKSFSSEGNYPFYVYPLIPGGIINVTSIDIPIHSTNDDFILTLYINSILEGTNMQVQSISNTNFTISYSGTADGFFVLKNTGDKKAINIKLDGDWFTFDKNNFDLDIGATKAVNFMISPLITATSDTNKTHIKQIKISGDNINLTTQDINIFIPYSSIVEGNITSAEWWNAKKVFCTLFPSSPYCATEPIIIEKEVPEYGCPDVLANLSAVDVQEALRQALKAYDSAENANNFLKLLANSMNMTEEQIRVLLNESISTGNENKKSIDDLTATTIITIFGTLFVVGILGTGYYMWRGYKRKQKEIFGNNGRGK